MDSLAVSVTLSGLMSHSKIGVRSGNIHLALLFRPGGKKYDRPDSWLDIIADIQASVPSGKLSRGPSGTLSHWSHGPSDSPAHVTTDRLLHVLTESLAKGPVDHVSTNKLLFHSSGSSNGKKKMFDQFCGNFRCLSNFVWFDK